MTPLEDNREGDGSIIKVNEIATLPPQISYKNIIRSRLNVRGGKDVISRNRSVVRAGPSGAENLRVGPTGAQKFADGKHSK